MLASAIVIQLGGLMYYLDSEPFRAVTTDALRLTPKDSACIQSIQEGVITIEVNVSVLNRAYAILTFLGVMFNVSGICVLFLGDGDRISKVGPDLNR